MCLLQKKPVIQPYDRWCRCCVHTILYRFSRSHSKLRVYMRTEPNINRKPWKKERKTTWTQILVIGHSCNFFDLNQLFSCRTEISRYTCTTAVGNPVFLFVVIPFLLIYLWKNVCVPREIDMIYNLLAISTIKSTSRLMRIPKSQPVAKINLKKQFLHREKVLTNRSNWNLMVVYKTQKHIQFQINGLFFSDFLFRLFFNCLI